jgi:hypothetical protein
LVSARPSAYLEKLASMPESYLLERPKPQPYVFQPIYYIFYGTLMKPDILKGVLDLETDVVLRDAKVYGYELTNWGQYKALIDGETGSTVTGRAYLVQSVQHEFKLAHYETNAYELASCNIYFTDDSGREEDEPVFGKTFRYAGDAQALKEGRFDRTLWEMLMGARLPPKWHEEAGRDTEQK